MNITFLRGREKDSGPWVGFSVMLIILLIALW